MAVPASAVADLLQRPDVWRGGQLSRAAAPVRASGHAALDAVLPGGGWPCGELTELLSRETGIGELSLLLPALAALDPEAGWVVLVAPPWRPHAPAWLAAGVPLDRLLVVEAGAPDAAWACEQLLASGALAALLAWLPDSDARGLRRLQLAAHGHRSLAFVFRPHTVAASASPAPLRLALAAAEGGLAVEVLKRRGPPLAASLRLAVPRPLHWDRLAPAAPVAGAAPAAEPTPSPAPPHLAPAAAGRRPPHAAVAA